MGNRRREDPVAGTEANRDAAGPGSAAGTEADRAGDTAGPRRAGAPWALLTGASSGLGRAVAAELALEGYRLILVARREERLRELAASLPTEALVVAADLTTDRRVARIETALARAGIVPGDIALLVNNAGTGTHGPFLEDDPATMERAIRLNIDAPAMLTRWIAPAMVARGGGTVCNIASVAAFTPGPLMAAYYAAKAWMLSFGESLDAELRPHNVRVVTCCPGPFASEFHQAAGIDPRRLGRLPAAGTIARGVVQAIRRGRTVAPIGFVPTVWAIIGPRLPRRWSRAIVGALQRRRRSSTIRTTSHEGDS